MQPLTSSEEWSVTYELPRDVVLSVYWRRLFFRRSLVIALVLMFMGAVSFFFLGGAWLLASGILLVFTFALPVGFYKKIGKAVDSNPALIDRKTVEFSPVGITAIGPNWKIEFSWTRFRGFSEDSEYFFLHLDDNGMAMILPKSVFTSGQLDKLREYANTKLS